MFFKIFFTLFMFFDSYGDEFSIPFEQCSEDSLKYTERLVKEGDLFVPESYNLLPSVGSSFFDFYKPSSFFTASTAINPVCFFASSVRSIAKPPGIVENHQGKKTDNYYYCDSAHLKDVQSNPIRPCLNKDYVMMTYKAFHRLADCFGFSQEEQKYLFALFNHESSFILNNKSPTGARCYGQVTLDMAEDINRAIYLSHSPSAEEESQIYRDVFDRCEELVRENILIPDSLRPEDRGKRTHDGFEKYKNFARAMTCPLTQHAPSCFFYSMYGMKMNLNLFESTLEREIHRISPTKVPEQIAEDFLFPIRLNEMLLIQGNFKEADGELVYRDWLMQDNYEMYSVIYDKKGNKKRDYNLADLKIKKVKVYEMAEHEKWSLLFQAYNGGGAVVNEDLRQFIRNQKALLARGSYCRKERNKNKQVCIDREQIKQGQPLDFKMNLFQRSVGLRFQTRQFTKKIIRDINYINDVESDREPATLIDHLHSLHNLKEEESEGIFSSFIETVREYCPNTEQLAF